MEDNFGEIDDLIFELVLPDTFSPLSRAVRDGDLETIKKLLRRGCLPQTPDNKGWTAIHVCVAANQLEALKLILKIKNKNKKYLVNLLTWENVSPLIIATRAKAPSLDIIKILLKAGASPNQCNYTNLSPLHLACMKTGTLDIVKLLVRHGAEVNKQEDISRFTALHFAVCLSRDINIIKYLIDITDLTLLDSEGRTAFLEACKLNLFEVIKAFLNKDRTLVNETGDFPPLVYACVYGNVEVVRYLVELGADPNCRCKAILSARQSELLLLDLKNYLPIYSSLTNLETFKFLLKLTNPEEILAVNTIFCNFPLFVMIYAKDIIFFETLLQSNLPKKLKTFNCKIIINFILGSRDTIKLVLKKFPLFFKYNFCLEPEEVFKNFVSFMSTEELLKNYKFLHQLAQMGISSANYLSKKHFAIQNLESYAEKQKEKIDMNLIKSTCDLLSQSVLSLKQYSRIAVRRYIKSLTECDYLAITIVQKSCLPESVKKFLLFEVCL